MPHDPALLAETRAWLIKSKQDLKAAEVLLDADTALAIYNRTPRPTRRREVP